MYDPLMITVEEAARAKFFQPQTAEQKPPVLDVVTAESIRLDYWLDKSLNPSLRGLLFDWILDPAQKHLKSDYAELTIECMKKAKSYNETRLTNRMPWERVNEIAQSVARSVKDGTAALKRHTHHKEDILKHRDPKAYRAEQAKAGYVSGLVRRGNAQKRWRAVWSDVRRGELSIPQIAEKHGIHRRTVYKIISHFKNPE